MHAHTHILNFWQGWHYQGTCQCHNITCQAFGEWTGLDSNDVCSKLSPTSTGSPLVSNTWAFKKWSWAETCGTELYIDKAWNENNTVSLGESSLRVIEKLSHILEKKWYGFQTSNIQSKSLLYCTRWLQFSSEWTKS